MGVSFFVTPEEIAKLPVGRWYDHLVDMPGAATQLNWMALGEMLGLIRRTGGVYEMKRPAVAHPDEFVTGLTADQHKLRSNDGWIITPPECASVVALGIPEGPLHAQPQEAERLSGSWADLAQVLPRGADQAGVWVV